MELAVVGAGHVGAVCAACMAAVGHRVRVVDVDAQRIALLRAGRAPFFEPGISELLEQGRTRELLSFHVDPAEALPGAALVFLCVNTDNGPDGSVDLSYVESAVQTVSRFADDGAVLVNRSTAPVGTAEYIRSMIEELRGGSLHVAVNPEFLAEGTAVHDFLEPDRILVGAWDKRPIALLADAYAPIVERRDARPVSDVAARRTRPAASAARTAPIPPGISRFAEKNVRMRYAANYSKMTSDFNHVRCCKTTHKARESRAPQSSAATVAL